MNLQLRIYFFICLNIFFFNCNSQTNKEATKQLLIGKYHIYKKNNCFIGSELLPDSLLLFLVENDKYYFNVKNSITRKAEGNWDISSEKDEFAYFFFRNHEGQTTKSRTLKIIFKDENGNKCEIEFTRGKASD